MATRSCDMRVTIEGFDFSEAPRDQIDFSEFEFGDYSCANQRFSRQLRLFSVDVSRHFWQAPHDFRGKARFNRMGFMRL
jgi:hypothetical protein